MARTKHSSFILLSTQLAWVEASWLSGYKLLHDGVTNVLQFTIRPVLLCSLNRLFKIKCILITGINIIYSEFGSWLYNDCILRVHDCLFVPIYFCVDNMPWFFYMHVLNLTHISVWHSGDLVVFLFIYEIYFWCN